jgi:hypothetical protein
LVFFESLDELYVGSYGLLDEFSHLVGHQSSS